jgi:predicted O-methyltransferase YrrM
MMKPSIDIDTFKGFLDQKEGHALYSYALDAGALGPVLEVGSYCGKSTVYLGQACREKSVSLYAIDHHRGSEEHQPGEEYHDQDLFDCEVGLMDTFWEFRRTMRNAALEDVVVPIVASSLVASRNWHTPLSMVFIDGGHSLEAAQADYRSWASHVMKDGILAIHDVFPDPTEGGQAPYEILKLAVASGLFEEVERIETLGLLRRR